MMKISKKTALFFVSLFFAAGVYGQPNEGVVAVNDVQPSVMARTSQKSVPSLLEGVWQGKDRLVMFTNDNEFALVLRVFYQWYNDRAAEPSSFRELKSRDRNDATVSPSEDIEVEFISVVENPSKTAGVYELRMKYPFQKEYFYIPVCIIDKKLYLDFLIKDSAQITDLRKSSAGTASLSSDGFYRSASNARGITIALPILKNEVVSYFVHENDIYKVRYWLSEMDYSYVQASFSDGDKIFSVDKYLRIGDKVYQCTTGRSSKIRNIEKLSKFEQTATYDSDGGIAAFGEPYLILVPEIKDKESFLVNLEENNRRKRPAPKPLFPPAQIDFHWKEITELEKYNPYTWNKRNLDIHK